MPPYDALVGSGPSYCIGSLCSTVRLLAPGHAQVRALPSDTTFNSIVVSVHPSFTLLRDAASSMIGWEFTI